MHRAPVSHQKFGKSVPGFDVNVPFVIGGQFLDEPGGSSSDGDHCYPGPLLPIEPYHFEERRKRIVGPARSSRQESLRLQY
jgi:hypothetical protein